MPVNVPANEPDHETEADWQSVADVVVVVDVVVDVVVAVDAGDPVVAKAAKLLRQKQEQNHQRMTAAAEMPAARSREVQMQVAQVAAAGAAVWEAEVQTND